MNKYLFWPIRIKWRRDYLRFFRFVKVAMGRDYDENVAVWAWFVCIGPLKIAFGFEL
jgi:hypothetical protein